MPFDTASPGRINAERDTVRSAHTSGSDRTKSLAKHPEQSEWAKRGGVGGSAFNPYPLVGTFDRVLRKGRTRPFCICIPIVIVGMRENMSSAQSNVVKSMK